MNILDTIIANKKIEVAGKKQIVPVSDLELYPNFSMPVRSLSMSLLRADSTGIIAEFKRKSPSKGFIQEHADVESITSCYSMYGAAALSVLGDEQFFGAYNDDLLKARKNDIPILRKEFIIDEYQVTEAKALGADAILLIAACLTPAEVKHLAKQAATLNLEVILELHAEEELEHVCDETNIIGINNRNLKTFDVNIERSLKMAEQIPTQKIKIAESGINDVENILLFRQNGFKGFLIGEHFMKQPDTCAAFRNFVTLLKSNT